MKRLHWQLICIGVISLIGFWLRCSNLGQVNLYNDEYYQFETAVGYLKTGQWARYNFYTQQAETEYTRALPFTAQIVASLKVFGISEAAARFPAVVWGALLIPFMMGLIWWLTKQPWLAYGVGAVLALDDFMIGMSRYVRMYTMLIVCALIIAVAVYAFAEAKTQRRWWWLGLAGITSLVSLSIFKELTLAVFGAIAVYVFIRALVFVIHRQSHDRWWALLGAVGIIVISVAVILQILGYNIYPADAIILRGRPHWNYLFDLYDNWRLPIIAYGFFLIGVATQWRHRRSFVMYCAVLSLIVVGYFVFLSHRWEALRYISFVIPFVTVVTVTGFITTIRFIWGILPQRRWLQIPLTLGLVFLAGPWLSLPGLPVKDVWVHRALADRTTVDIGYPDIRTAYRYVEQHYQPGEVVLIQTPRFYYWTNPQIPVHKLGGYKRLTFVDFVALANSGQGGWLVYDFSHQRHLRDKIKQYAENRFAEVDELDKTLVYVYHFTPEDLEKRRSTKK